MDIIYAKDRTFTERGKENEKNDHGLPDPDAGHRIGVGPFICGGKERI
jgi:hypothetical protein